MWYDKQYQHPDAYAYAYAYSYSYSYADTYSYADAYSYSYADSYSIHLRISHTDGRHRQVYGDHERRGREFVAS
jgi:hypothetical protein